MSFMTQNFKQRWAKITINKKLSKYFFKFEGMIYLISLYRIIGRRQKKSANNKR